MTVFTFDKGYSSETSFIENPFDEGYRFETSFIFLLVGTGIVLFYTVKLLCPLSLLNAKLIWALFFRTTKNTSWQQILYSQCCNAVSVSSVTVSEKTKVGNRKIIVQVQNFRLAGIFRLAYIYPDNLSRFQVRFLSRAASSCRLPRSQFSSLLLLFSWFIRCKDAL